MAVSTITQNTPAEARSLVTRQREQRQRRFLLDRCFRGESLAKSAERIGEGASDARKPAFARQRRLLTKMFVFGRLLLGHRGAL